MMYASFINYGANFNSYSFKSVYVFDLDKDVLFIEKWKANETRSDKILDE